MPIGVKALRIVRERRRAESGDRSRAPAAALTCLRAAGWSRYSLWALRVGLVCPYSLTLPGGVQGQVLGLGRALREMGIEARVLGPCDGPPPDPNVTPLGNSIPTAANGSMAAIAPDPAATLRVIRALREERFDVVHIHEPLVPGPTLSATIFSDSPMVGTFHRAGQSSGYRITSPLARIATNRLALRTAVSEDARATATEVVGGEYEIVWNGIDLDRYAPEPMNASPQSPHRFLRRRRKQGGSDRTILFVGRHEHRKGLAVLIDALDFLPPDVRLWVAGEGPDTARLERRTEGDPRIEWLGVISEEEKIGRLQAADIFCAPSLSGESFGVVLLEGMAAGAVVVASDLPGYRNVARGGVEALLSPPGDAESLAGQLRLAVAGGPVIDAMIEAARARAEGFSMRNLAALYAERYETVVSRHPAPTPRGETWRDSWNRRRAGWAGLLP